MSSYRTLSHYWVLDKALSLSDLPIWRENFVQDLITRVIRQGLMNATCQQFLKFKFF